jgi:hypothetical protein
VSERISSVTSSVPILSSCGSLDHFSPVGPTAPLAIPHLTRNCASSVSVPIVPEFHIYLCGAKGLCNQSMRCLNFFLPTPGLRGVRMPYRCQHAGRLISKREPFRPRLSKTRRHHQVPSGLCVDGEALEGLLIARSRNHGTAVGLRLSPARRTRP